MAKFVCTICGYVHEGDNPPVACPLCGAPADKFKKQDENQAQGWADEHRIGVGQGVDAEVLQGLKEHFQGECTEVGMYLAMSRQADREGYPEVAEFAELLGEVVTDSTKKNLQMRVDAECGACAAKKAIASRAKELNLDAIHDTVHEMCKDEARHGQAFAGLLKRYFS